MNFNIVKNSYVYNTPNPNPSLPAAHQKSGWKTDFFFSILNTFDTQARAICNKNIKMLETIPEHMYQL